MGLLLRLPEDPSLIASTVLCTGKVSIQMDGREIVDTRAFFLLLTADAGHRASGDDTVPLWVPMSFFSQCGGPKKKNWIWRLKRGLFDFVSFFFFFSCLNGVAKRRTTGRQIQGIVDHFLGGRRGFQAKAHFRIVGGARSDNAMYIDVVGLVGEKMRFDKTVD